MRRIEVVGTDHEPDAAIVARVLDGDTAAYEVLVRRYRRAAYIVALAITGIPDEADDVCQDAFVNGYDQLHTCRSPHNIGPWLFQIVRNAARNHQRTINRRRTIRLDDIPPLLGPQSTSARVERSDLRELLLRALSHLSPVQREVVLLHGLDGWRHAQIASALGISEMMSRRHLSDARQALRPLLAGYYLEDTVDNG